MTVRSFEVRVCSSCGLRYPLVEGNPFGIRCPHCLADTFVVLEKKLGEDMAKGALARTHARSRMHVLLDNVRSAWNTGSILRSADGFGFNHVYICGITPTPEQAAVQKTSLGAEENVTWSYHKDAVRLVRGLIKEGWKVLALEHHEKAVSLEEISRTKGRDIVVIVGNEVTGVDQDLLDLSVAICYIPMFGKKSSLNVAIAFAVAASQLSS